MDIEVCNRQLSKILRRGKEVHVQSTIPSYTVGMDFLFTSHVPHIMQIYADTLAHVSNLAKTLVAAPTVGAAFLIYWEHGMSQTKSTNKSTDAVQIDPACPRSRVRSTSDRVIEYLLWLFEYLPIIRISG